MGTGAAGGARDGREEGSQPLYRDEEGDEELEAVPPGTVPRPERSDMENIWKDDDEEDVAVEALRHGTARQ